MGPSVFLSRPGPYPLQLITRGENEREERPSATLARAHRRPSRVKHQPRHKTPRAGAGVATGGDASAKKTCAGSEGIRVLGIY